MACAAGYATLQVIEEENILNNVNGVSNFIMDKLNQIKDNHQICGDVRGKGLLLAINLVKGKNTREPFVKAGKMVYEKAFSKGLAWILAGNILLLSPP